MGVGIMSRMHSAGSTTVWVRASSNSWFFNTWSSFSSTSCKTVSKIMAKTFSIKPLPVVTLNWSSLQATSINSYCSTSWMACTNRQRKISAPWAAVLTATQCWFTRNLENRKMSSERHMHIWTKTEVKKKYVAKFQISLTCWIPWTSTGSIWTATTLNFSWRLLGGSPHTLQNKRIKRQLKLEWNKKKHTCLNNTEGGNNFWQHLAESYLMNPLY